MRTPLLFADLFYGLRQAGLKVGVSEWMALMEALARGVVHPDLNDFYGVARSLLIKDESFFDTWDQVFSAVFADGELPVAAVESALAWLEDPKAHHGLTPEEVAALEKHPLEELRRLFEERLKEQDARHDGGNRWVGTGGTSPFGHGGQHPAGVRVGGAGGGRSAVQIASERQFRAYRKDIILDTRSMAVALRKLRRLGRDEGEPELDLDETIDATGRNAGELTLEFAPPRRNQARVLLMMDVGGSMTPHSRLVDRLFSAASGLNHWRDFKAYSFHNCPYETIYPKRYGHDGIPTGDILRDVPPETCLIMVGDASMAPGELLDRGGAIDYWHQNQTPGIVWLHRLRTRFKRAIWLNPIPNRWWRGYSIELVRTVFPMFPLTLEGLEAGIDHLRTGEHHPIAPLDPRWFRES